VLPRYSSLRSRVPVALVALLATVLTVALVAPSGAHPADAAHGSAKPNQDLRKTQVLFVDSLMPAANQGTPYAQALGRKAQALWIIPEAYPTSSVRGVVRAYTSRALGSKKTPMLSVYGIPDRDCGGQSSAGALQDAAAYRAWIRQIGKGVKDQKALVILEPDALPFYGDPSCSHTGNRLGMLAFASKTLSQAGAWVYIDAGHSNWTPYDDRPLLLKKAGIEYARGFSTNVSNFRPTSDEQKYAQFLLAGLRKLGIRGKHYVIDTSRNGAVPSSDGNDVLNPTWARVGKAPKLVFKGSFDGTLWVKHPGESDGYINGGNASGKWCDLLADRLLGRPESSGC
jgi:endoglucanase